VLHFLIHYPNSPPSSSCFNCGGCGHMSRECTQAARPRPCNVCGATDHRSTPRLPLQSIHPSLPPAHDILKPLSRLAPSPTSSSACTPALPHRASAVDCLATERRTAATGGGLRTCAGVACEQTCANECQWFFFSHHGCRHSPWDCIRAQVLTLTPSPNRIACANCGQSGLAP
jgi:hypothetical protein